MGSGTGGLYTPEERLNYIDAFIKVNQQPIDLDFWQQEYKKSQGCLPAIEHANAFSHSHTLHHHADGINP